MNQRVLLLTPIAIYIAIHPYCFDAVLPHSIPDIQKRWQGGVLPQIKPRGRGDGELSIMTVLEPSPPISGMGREVELLTLASAEQRYSILCWHGNRSKDGMGWRPQPREMLASRLCLEPTRSSICQKNRDNPQCAAAHSTHWGPKCNNRQFSVMQDEGSWFFAMR